MTEKLVLDEKLNTATAARLAEQMSAMEGKDVSLDASGVTFLGGLALQVLVAARKSCAAAGHVFEVTPRSDAFDEALVLAGFRPDDFDKEQ